MQCINPVRLFKNLSPLDFPDGLLVPCGKCIACRISKRREWSIRMLHELEDHDKSVFVTLTYSDDYLPQNESLKKEDLQKFMKRLRKSLEKSERKIRYFACGEYGDKTERPHYHLIIFGPGLKPDDKELVMKAWDKCEWTNPHIRNKSFGLVEPESIAYVAGYIDKKLSGDKAQEEYVDKSRIPVFRLCSLGIGRQYCDEQAKQITEMLHLTHRGIRMSVPRYYIKRLGIDPDTLKTHALDRDAELVEKLVGVYMTSDELYMSGESEMNTYVIERTQDSKAQHERNLTAKVQLKDRRL